MTDLAEPARVTPALRVLGWSGHAMGGLSVVALTWGVLVVQQDVTQVDDYWDGLAAGLAMWVLCLVVGVAAPLMTFQGPLQHLVLCSVLTFGLFALPIGHFLVLVVPVGLLVWLWSRVLQGAYPSPHWSREDWWARAIAVAIVPALAAATAAWGGLPGPSDVDLDASATGIVAARLEAAGEAVAVLAPAWIASMVAIVTRGRAQRVALGLAAAAALLAMMLLRSSINPWAV